MNSAKHKIKAGIVGAAGYAGGEVLRLLLNHPNVEISFVQSSSQKGKKISQVHGDLLGECDYVFSETHTSADVVFLCGGHGGGKEFMKNNSINACIVDLSNDFRLEPNNEGFVYGLPEINYASIQNANKIANPGCFATAIQLAVLPLAVNKLLPNEIFIQATTGSTGAGQSLSGTSHFSWRENNLSNYKVFSHQHEDEILQSINSFQKYEKTQMHFVPQRGDFTRGILVNCMMSKNESHNNLKNLYQKFYINNSFVHLSDEEINLKQVINTNKCLIHLHETKNELLITSAIDNLLKGAAGQAIHNMNIRFGFEEKAGLKLKPLAY